MLLNYTVPDTYSRASVSMYISCQLLSIAQPHRLSGVYRNTLVAVQLHSYSILLVAIGSVAVRDTCQSCQMLVSLYSESLLHV